MVADSFELCISSTRNDTPPAFLLSIAGETDEDEMSLMAASFNVTCDEIATAAITGPYSFAAGSRDFRLGHFRKGS
jgi:hypothetical protein